jgi:hypothetical protein
MEERLDDGVERRRLGDTGAGDSVLSGHTL